MDDAVFTPGDALVMPGTGVVELPPETFRVLLLLVLFGEVFADAVGAVVVLLVNKETRRDVVKEKFVFVVAVAEMSERLP